jgi:uncharacterized iron-regulated protein
MDIRAYHTLDSVHPQLRLHFLVFLGCLATSLGGCASTPEAAAPVVPQEMSMFDRDGAPLRWADVIGAMESAQVVILGEQHNDGAAHAMQLELVREGVRRWPGTSLALEMLERDEQAELDDYLEGIIDAEQLTTLTHSADWGGKGSWATWYQPIIDAARDGGAPVVAANAPRRYVRLARTDGFERLEALPDSRRALVAVPEALIEGGYRDRFREVMGGGHDTNGSADQSAIDAAYRAQLVWDATMADSIARALRGGATRVIHLVGQFHADFDGGTVQELRRRAPGVRVMVISMQPVASEVLRAEDRGRADVVVYTGRH